MFGPPRYQYLARIVTFRSITAAREAARLLLRLFKEAKTRAKKVRIKRATVLAANRARVLARSRSLRPETKKRLRRIAYIYERAAERMVLT